MSSKLANINDPTGSNCVGEELRPCGDIALEVNGEQITLHDVLTLAKWRGRLQFVEEATDLALIRQAAQQRGIEVSADEFQRAADDFRVSRELYDVRATEKWLVAHQLTHEEWESLLEDDVIAGKLREELTAGKVEEYFALHRLSFDAAAVSRIVVADENVAKELRLQIAEEGADFHALARRHSADAATKPAGGYVGLVRREETEAGLESAVFGARAGDVVGPIKTDEGWQVVKVEALHRATLDEVTLNTIKTLLFTEWLSERRRKAQIKAPLLRPQS